MTIKKLIQSVGRDILLGDDARDNETAGGLFARWGRIRGGEEGQINLVSAIVVLGFVVLIGLIGNAGHAVKEKIELQNAADATAYSSALWMARGMNAITTTNHLMGEATAVVVVFNSFGGSELGDKQPVPTSRNLNTLLKNVQNIPPGVPILTGQYDRGLVQYISREMTEDQGRHAVHAAILDGKLTLKSWMLQIFAIKVLANVGLIPNPAYFITAPAAFATHIAMDGLAVWLMKEWFFLEFLESGIQQIAETGFIEQIKETIIPTLSKYGDFVAGTSLSFGGSSQIAPINRSIKRTFASVNQRYNVSKSAIYPAVDELRLPVQKEKEPQSGGSEIESEWSNTDLPGPLRQIQAAFRQINNAIDRANRVIDALLAPAGWFGKIVGSDVVDKLKPPKLPEIPFPGDKGFSDNPSYKSLPRIDVSEERYSQWVRATYPVVDSYRAPIRKLLLVHARASNAATWYTHWANRYTLATSHRIRTSNAKPHMYVIRNSTPRNKGSEPWTRATAQGKRMAERFFTIIAVVHRKKHDPLIGPIIYRNAAKEGHFAVAQAIFYNSNGTGPSEGGRQPNTGWDTLNWQPPVRAWEWGGHKPSNGNMSDALRPFVGGLRATRESRVKINWQAKLVPITPTRLGDAIADPRFEGEMRPILRRMQKYHDPLVTH